MQGGFWGRLYDVSFSPMEKVVNRFTTCIWSRIPEPELSKPVGGSLQPWLDTQVYKQSAIVAHQISQAKSKKPKPEPKSPSPATSSPEIAESEESKSQAETLIAKVVFIFPPIDHVSSGVWESWMYRSPHHRPKRISNPTTSNGSRQSLQTTSTDCEMLPISTRSLYRY